MFAHSCIVCVDNIPFGPHVANYVQASTTILLLLCAFLLPKTYLEIRTTREHGDGEWIRSPVLLKHANIKIVELQFTLQTFSQAARWKRRSRRRADANRMRLVFWCGHAVTYVEGSPRKHCGCAWWEDQRVDIPSKLRLPGAEVILRK